MSQRSADWELFTGLELDAPRSRSIARLVDYGQGAPCIGLKVNGDYQKRLLDKRPQVRGRWAAWYLECEVWLEFIQPGKAAPVAYAESLNGRIREQCLNANRFMNLSDARRKIESWRQDYDQERLHSSLNYLAPAQCACK